MVTIADLARPGATAGPAMTMTMMTADPPPAAAGPPRCRHCGRGKRCRPRGLCTGCFDKPAVRLLYPSTSKYAKRGVGAGFAEPPPPAEPVAHAPGSREKLATLAERAARGVGLWHPRDGPACD